jgi:hypothetical protein
MSNSYVLQILSTLVGGVISKTTFFTLLFLKISDDKAVILCPLHQESISQCNKELFRS